MIGILMQLQTYFERIQYAGSLEANRETLRQLHRAHLQAIPYENLDIHLGQQLTLNLPQIYDKIVRNQRGGWCYEMNGLFAWALEELGFAVTMLGSTVGATTQGEEGDRDHLILRVDLEEPWLVDVGFGNGFLEPLPLRPGEHQQGFFHLRLEQQDAAWFFHNHAHGGPGYGFTLLPRRYTDFAQRCRESQTSPESHFVRTTICYRFTDWGFVALRGAMLKEYYIHNTEEEEITTQDRYAEVLEARFGLASNLAAGLWAGVQERHQQWQEEQRREDQGRGEHS